jgi:hypothetical protein
MASMTEVGRLCFRHEGEWWNAYWSPDQHSMDRALLIGSIRMTTTMDKEVREQFKALMRAAFSAVAEDVIGQTPDWIKPPRKAPERERSGHA